MGVNSWGAIQYLMNGINNFEERTNKNKKQIESIVQNNLFNKLVERKTNIRIFCLTKKYTREKILGYFSLYSWREISRTRTRTEEALQELGSQIEYNFIIYMGAKSSKS